ncbi:MAG: hypothetical protein AAFY60_11340, partial [Myxococcota bacterium]
MSDPDWSTLSHAYGPAEDVPELLRGLLSDSHATREAALDGLWGVLHHQGDVYDSTVAAVPYLIAVVQEPRTQDRAKILEVLESLARMPGDFDPSSVRDLYKNFPKFIATDEYLATRLRDAERMHGHRVAASTAIQRHSKVFLELVRGAPLLVAVSAFNVSMRLGTHGAARELALRLERETKTDARRVAIEALAKHFCEPDAQNALESVLVHDPSAENRLIAQLSLDSENAQARRIALLER